MYSVTVGDLVLLEEGDADLVALGLEEGVRHAAADQQPVGLAEQLVDDGELVGDLGTAEHHDVGPLDVLGELLEHRDLGGDQLARGVREAGREVVDGGVLAVHGAEAVADVQVGELGELVGEGAALGVVLAGLTGVEAEVLQDGDLALAQAVDDGPGGLADGVRGERHLAAQQLTQPLRGGRQGVGRVRGALGAAQVGGDDDLGAVLGELGDRRLDGADPAVVGDGRAVERHVEVGADEDPLARHPFCGEIVDRLHTK
jgi:hypothetical protein